MEVINITEEQRNEICDILARLTYKFKQDKDVECIYFAPYKRKNCDNVLSVVLVKKRMALEKNKRIINIWNKELLKD